MSGTATFFQAMAPSLITNVSTVVFVYCFAVISQRERNGGLYSWGVYPFYKRRSAASADGDVTYVERVQR